MQQQTDTQIIKRINFFARREMLELPRLLLPGEEVLAVISGVYTAGTAILCITSKRILLVDKKAIRLSFEDVRFEAVKEVTYSQQVFTAALRFFYAGRELQFTSWYRSELRMIAQLVQQKMFEVREKTHVAPQKETVTVAETLFRDHSGVSQSERQFPSVLNPGSNAQLEQYLQERIARWRRASRFVESLPSSQVD